MEVKFFLSFIFVLFVILLLAFYWFIPHDAIEFGIKSGNSNFSLDGFDSDMQFYENMRYPAKAISYNIHNCTLQKKDDMLAGFDIVSNKTVLEFYPTCCDERITVSCDDKERLEGGLFIAGEGGPMNITKSGEFNVILRGKVLLIKPSQCERPNVAIHELLHALGFAHSSNRENIMYNYSRCDQTIGDDIINLIDDLYLFPSYADLVLENASAVMRGKYLDTNITIRNNGLDEARDIDLLIYANGKFVKDIDLEPLGIGYGRLIVLSNILVLQRNVNELTFLLNSSIDELDKENNEIILEIKK